MLLRIERFLNFLASVIGVTTFAFGFLNIFVLRGLSEQDQNTLPAIVAAAVSFGDNVLVQLIVFSFFDFALALISVRIVIYSLSKLRVFNFFFVPAIIIVSYLSSVIVMDIVFYEGELKSIVNEDAPIFPIDDQLRLAWPMIVSVLFEMVAIIDKELSIYRKEQGGSSADVKVSQIFDDFYASYEFVDEENLGKEKRMYFVVSDMIPPIYFYLFVVIIHAAVAYAAVHAYW